MNQQVQSHLFYFCNADAVGIDSSLSSVMTLVEPIVLEF